MTFALCLPLVLLSAAAAEAQRTQPERPFRGLFGPPPQRDPRGPQPIDLTMSLSGGYDNNAIDQLAANSLNVPFQRTGLYSNVDTALRYARGGRARHFTVTGGSALRYYPAPYQLLSTNYQGTVAFASPVWSGAHLDASQGAGYTPYYQFELFPSLSADDVQAPKGASSDYAIWKQPAYTYTSAVRFVQKLSTRTELGLQYDRRDVRFSSGASDLLTQSGGFGLTFRLTRYAGFHAGVTSRGAQYQISDGANRLRTYDIDLGLNYDRPLSFSRRTTLRFASGSSLIPQDGKTHYRVTGNAALTREIARTWAASLRYDRAMQFVEAFSQPFFSDALAASATGNPSRRVNLAFSGGYSAGTIGVSSEGGTFGTYTGAAQMGISVNRHFALYSEYLYYHYRFSQQSLAASFPGGLDRQTARVGLKVWFPLFD